jgi:hypothetical protein
VTHNKAWCLFGGDVHVMAGMTRHPGEVGNASTHGDLHDIAGLPNLRNCCSTVFLAVPKESPPSP